MTRNNKMTGKFAWRFVAAFAIILAWAASAAAQTVVVGTGNPDIDVPAVQAAVNQGGQVILKGHFSFNRPPTVPTATSFVGGLATVLVWKAVAISGTQDGDDEMASIEGGTTPFYVEASGASVTIQGLRFIRPKGDAIFVYAVSGLVIASCKIEGVETLQTIGGGDGIDINTSSGVPMPTNPGKPENISGTLLVANNDIDVAGGTAQDLTVGVLIFSVGVPGAEVEAYVSGNKIRNTTEPAINFRRVGGRVYVERNVLTTGSVAGPAGNLQAIRVVNTGSYVIAHNSIDCAWPQAAGIGVFSQIAAWPLERAVVVDNDVTMSAPEGTVFGANSAGIEIRGIAQGNMVMNNRIRGRARAALAVTGTTGNNTFVSNDLDGFQSSLADVFVDAGVTNTVVVGRQISVEDHGGGTVVVPMP
jgi:Right handed beta helix region